MPASAYEGLRKTCRLVRSEYDHKARRGVAKAWEQYVDAMATLDIDILPSSSGSLSSSTLELVLPRWLLNATEDFPAGLIPWQWSWVTHVNIHIDASDIHHNLYSLQDTMQKLDNHIHRNTFQASEGFQTLPLDPRTTIEQVDFLWYNFPPHLVIANYTYWCHVRRVYRAIEQFNACWYTARVRDEDGVVFGMRWRRRRLMDVARVLVILASPSVLMFLMPSEVSAKLAVVYLAQVLVFVTVKLALFS